MLLDNKTSGHVGNELKKHTFSGSWLSVLSSLFTLYGFASLKHELKQLDSARIIFTEWDSLNLQNMVGSESDIRLLNQLQQKRIASEFTQWLANKADVKASVRPQAGQNIIHLQSPEENFTISGSATLTPTGLGEVRSDSLQMNMGLSDSESTQQLLAWFDSVWADAHNVCDIKDDLVGLPRFSKWEFKYPKSHTSKRWPLDV